MTKGDYLGEFEIVVLSTLLHLGDNAYGMTIRCAIEERGGRAKCFFGLEPAGGEAIARSRAMFDRLWDDLPEGRS